MQGRLERGIVAGSAVAVAAFAALYAWPGGEERWVAAAYNLVTVGAIAAAGAVCFARGRRSHGPDRTAWVLLGLSCVAWAVGEAGWAFQESVLRQPIPFPAWMDVPYLLNVPLAAAGVLAFAWRPQSTRRQALRVLDAATAVLGLFLVAWVVFLKAVVVDAQTNLLATVVTVLYPLGDVAILAALALSVAHLPPRRLRALAPLLAGFALVALADAGYTVVVLRTGGYGASFFDLAYLAAPCAILWAAVRRDAPDAGAPARDDALGRLEEWLPYALALPVVAALGWEALVTGDLEQSIETAGLAWAVLFLLRQFLFIRMHLGLARRLAETQRIAGLGGWAWDARSRSLLLDDGAGHVLGVAGGTALGLDALLAATPADAAAQARASWDRLCGQGEPFEATVRVQAPGGERWVLLQARPGPPPHGTLLDVTVQHRLAEERRRADAQQLEVGRLKEMNRFKTQFINMAAHELNTPLTPIRLSLANLKRHADDHRRHGMMQMLERNVDRLTALLHDVLEGARIQADRLRLERRPMDLAHLARDVVEEHRPVADEAGVTLACTGPSEVWVDGDARRLHEVLLNLLGNALRFTPRGGRVEVTVAGEGGVGRVTVADSGVGIRDADLGRLFQPFSQVGADAGNAGTGLGLYICRGILEQHGGRIWAESAGEGHGARFAFEVPLVQPGAPEARAKAAPAAA